MLLSKPTTLEYTVFLSIYGTFTKLTHTGPNKFQDENHLGCFLGPKAINLENNSYSIARKMNVWEIGNRLLNNPCVTQTLT